MLVGINKIGSEQALPTTDTIKKTKILVDYAATEPDAVIRFHASDMCLHIDSDTAYIVQPKASSHDAGHYYLRETPPPPLIRPNPTPNIPIISRCQTIRTVISSAAEAETGAIFLNGKQDVHISTNLIEMGHPQPPTPTKADKSNLQRHPRQKHAL